MGRFAIDEIYQANVEREGEKDLKEFLGLIKYKFGSGATIPFDKIASVNQSDLNWANFKSQYIMSWRKMLPAEQENRFNQLRWNMTEPMRELFITHIGTMISIEARSTLRQPASRQQQATPPQPRIVKTQDLDPYSDKPVLTPKDLSLLKEKNSRNLALHYSFSNT